MLLLIAASKHTNAPPAGGQYQGRIRSLCQFFNSTDMVLEVALLEEEDSLTWTLLPTTASQAPAQAGAAASVGDVMEEEVRKHMGEQEGIMLA